MNETSTKIFNAYVNKTAMKESDVTTFNDVDDMMFYHAIRPDLDLLQKVPKQKTIERILSFSQSTH